MLFTRCPVCQTTFRITADTLRIANGAVRCGSCATVFSAYSGLRQDTLDEAMRQDDALLSPTMQSQELAAIEEIASPELADDDDDALAAASTEDENAGEFVVLETLPEDLDSESDEAARSEQPEDLDSESDEDLPSDLAATPAAEPSPETLTARDAEPSATEETPLEPEGAAAEAAQEESGSLHFDAPVDEWSQLLSEIERSVSGDEPKTEDIAAEQADNEGTSSADAPRGRESTAPEFSNVSEPFSLGSWETGEREPLPPEQPAIPADPKPGPDAASSAPADRAEESDDELYSDIVISAEQIDATLSAAPDADLVAALEAGLGQLPESGQTPRIWTFGAAALALVLAMQIVHHYRSALASRPIIGAVIQTTYGVLGLEVVPAWDLEQYEITNWAATAGPGDLGAGNLHITAQIRNIGPKAQPYPSIQLELKDRWEAVIGSRIFPPSEYLTPNFDPSGLMAVGAVVPADLAVVDPGLDASGFELDVCLKTTGGRVSCAADRVFE
jgi:predicted Zn finger-like uncharacterized protein